ncbi:MAG: ImmA/IrrE family metallo-endopeptidase [Bythopirellula sp.]|nr:ImmA/IrrE family metallo-endopeptidase [Bythopirellula sp.]
MARRIAMPGPKLRYMKDQEFEDEAALLLAEYSRQHVAVTAPPIPIDDIVADYLRLSVFYKDLKEEFGVGDVLGALWVNKRQVDIDLGLVPEDNPSMLGRYHFTLAHEAGHWRLHRHLFQQKANQLQLLPNNVERPEYICRSSDTEQIEYQANRFASCLLMPREMVKRAWHEWHGSMDAIYFGDLAVASDQPPTGTKDDPITRMLFEDAARPLAATFEVSPDAMRIRLEDMKLLLRKREPSLFE